MSFKKINLKPILFFVAFYLSLIPVISFAEGSFDDIVAQGSQYYNQGLYDQAIAEFTKAIALNPNDAQVYNRRAACSDDNGDYEFRLPDGSYIIKQAAIENDIFQLANCPGNLNENNDTLIYNKNITLFFLN